MTKRSWQRHYHRSIDRGASCYFQVEKCSGTMPRVRPAEERALLYCRSIAGAPRHREQTAGIRRPLHLPGRRFSKDLFVGTLVCLRPGSEICTVISSKFGKVRPTDVGPKERKKTKRKTPINRVRPTVQLLRTTTTHGAYIFHVYYPPIININDGRRFLGRSFISEDVAGSVVVGRFVVL